MFLEKLRSRVKKKKLMQIWFDSWNITEHTRLNMKGFMEKDFLQGTRLTKNSKAFLFLDILLPLQMHAGSADSFARNVFIDLLL